MYNAPIPITFDHDTKSYRGTFKPVHGAGANTWHLMINNYYKGQLWYDSASDRWSYYGNAFNGMGDYFGATIQAWVG